MEREVSGVNLITLLSFFNTFMKYIFMVYENRAYKKIRMYMNITIAKGQQYAAEQAKKSAKH